MSRLCKAKLKQPTEMLLSSFNVCSMPFIREEQKLGRQFLARCNFASNYEHLLSNFFNREVVKPRGHYFDFIVHRSNEELSAGHFCNLTRFDHDQMREGL